MRLVFDGRGSGRDGEIGGTMWRSETGVEREGKRWLSEFRWELEAGERWVNGESVHLMVAG